MARSAQRRTRQRGERRPTPRASAPAARKPTPTYEDTMFFPRLRRQAKWMFVFLALVFGLGYVIFNVGGTIPGVGLGDVLSDLRQNSAGGVSEETRATRSRITRTTRPATTTWRPRSSATARTRRRSLRSSVTSS